MKELISSLEETIVLNKEVINSTDFKKLNLKQMSPILNKSPIKQAEIEKKAEEETKIQDIPNSYIDRLFYNSERGYIKESYTSLPHPVSERKCKVSDDYREKFKIINDKYDKQFPKQEEVVALAVNEEDEVNNYNLLTLTLLIFIET